MKIFIYILSLFLTACATTNIDEKITTQSKTQCPIGYHLEQNPGVVIFSGRNDKNKHTIEFNCVVDSELDSYNNPTVN